MATKCTMLLQLGTTNAAGQPSRSGGWSESWYFNSDPGPSVFTSFGTLAQKRAALLPSSASIVGFRFQQTDGLTVGASITAEVNLPGTSGIVNDAPQVALKFLVPSAAGTNKKVLILRGIPDAVVVTGEYNPSRNFRTNVANFFNELGNGWAFRGQVLSALSAGFIQIAADGTFNLKAGTAIPANVNVKVLRTKNAAGRQKGGLYLLSAIAGLTGTLQFWDHGLCKGGRMRQYLITFPQVPRFPIGPPNAQVVVKKVGRVFNQYRGRKPVKSPG